MGHLSRVLALSLSLSLSSPSPLPVAACLDSYTVVSRFYPSVHPFSRTHTHTHTQDLFFFLLYFSLILFGIILAIFPHPSRWTMFIVRFGRAPGYTSRQHIHTQQDSTVYVCSTVGTLPSRFYLPTQPHPKREGEKKRRRREKNKAVTIMSRPTCVRQQLSLRV